MTPSARQSLIGRSTAELSNTDVYDVDPLSYTGALGRNVSLPRVGSAASVDLRSQAMRCQQDPESPRYDAPHLLRVSHVVVATKPGASSLDDLLMPGGSPLGVKGTDVAIREVAGGLTDAQAMFKQLSQGGKIVQQTPTITRVELPNGGFVQIRTTMSKSPKTAATIDVNIPGYDIDKIKFNP